MCLKLLNRTFPSFFPTFYIDMLGRISRHHWKEHFKITERPSLKVIRLKWVKIQLSKVAKIYRRLYGGRGGGVICVPNLPSHHTKVCKMSRLWGAISSEVFHKSLSSLAILFIPAELTDFVISLTCPRQKMEKTVQRYIIIRDIQINDSVTYTCPSSSFKSEVLAMAHSSVS